MTYVISIHALLAESDFHLYASSGVDFAISIHALLAESDSRYVFCPVRSKSHFYPRSPCGERQVGQKRLRQKLAISIHALLAESDSPASVTPAASRNFYPRSPCGERPFDVLTDSALLISIHALLAESDTTARILGFNPLISIHALLAESDSRQVTVSTWRKVFLSTLSLRRATESQQPCARPTKDFYPRSPCGERHMFR